MKTGNLGPGECDADPRQWSRRRAETGTTSCPAGTFPRHSPEGQSKGIMQKCEPQERILWAPKFEERPQNETVRQELCARGAAWNLAEDV